MCKPVGCENLITPPSRTRESPHRDGRDGEHEPREPSMRPMEVVAQVVRETMLDEADVRCNGSRTPREHAPGGVGSALAASRDIPSGRCARTSYVAHSTHRPLSALGSEQGTGI